VCLCGGNGNIKNDGGEETPRANRMRETAVVAAKVFAHLETTTE